MAEAAMVLKAQNIQEELDHERFEHNLSFFMERLPDVGLMLERIKPLTSLGIDPHGKWNVQGRDGKWLYRGGAEQYSQNRVEHFRKEPKRFQAYVGSENLEKYAQRFVDAAKERIEEVKTLKVIKDYYMQNSYTLAIFGAGLGFHIEELVNDTQCQHLLIVEDSPDYFYYSCYFIDWEKIYEDVEGRNGHVDLIFEHNEDSIFGQLRSKIWKASITELDGMVSYFDQPKESYGRVWARINAEYTNMFAGVGFFEDEFNHLKNTYNNLTKPDSMTLLRSKTKIDTPLFVVGSGPSLDESMETVRRYQGQAVILACGTAIESLMRAGITPDYILLLEREVELLEVYDTMAKKVDTHKVPLIASSTCMPGLEKYFSERISFFRPGLNPVSVFGRSYDEIMFHCDPTVTNTGVGFGIHLGFTNIYLFGVDFGSFDRDVHHAKNTVYEREDGMDYGMTFDHPCPGNFGGVVYTSMVLRWARFAMERVNPRRTSKHYYNCSNGAYIEGFVPKHYTTLELDESGDKQSALDHIKDHYDAYGPKTAHTRFVKANYPERAQELLDLLRDSVGDVDKLLNKHYAKDFHKAIWRQEFRNPVQMLVRGTVTTMLQYVTFVLNRVSDDEHRRIAATIFAEEYMRNCEAIMDDLAELVAEMEAKEISENDAQDLSEKEEEIEFLSEDMI